LNKGGLIYFKRKMFLQLNHQSLDIYKVSRTFVRECYFITKYLPDWEKFSLSQQIRRAALSVHLNISEGCSRKSEGERKRFYEVARGSVIEIDAALDICSDLEYLKKENLKELGLSMVRCFSMLFKMIATS
jgi:four helix bundle protein